MQNNDLFGRAAKVVARVTGKPATFGVAFLVIIVWAVTGPLFDYSDTWQLIINTSTTIVTFLMVFLIQATQNRDTAAIQLKLDELIRNAEGAHNALLDLEELTEEELERVRLRYCQLAHLARESVRVGDIDTDKPEIELFAEESEEISNRAAALEQIKKDKKEKKGHRAEAKAAKAGGKTKGRLF
jgi:low affinity Fe/Cu permease